MSKPKEPSTARVPQKRNFQALRGWTAEEDAVLDRYYGKGGAPACRPHLVDRTNVAIKRRAERRALVSGYTGMRELTPQQLADLKAVADRTLRMKMTKLADHVGLTESAVCKRLRKMRLSAIAVPQQ